MRPTDSPRRARRDGSRCARRSRHRRCVQRTPETDRRADQTCVEADAQSRLAGPFASDTRSQDSARGNVERETPWSPRPHATRAPNRPRARPARSRRRAGSRRQTGFARAEAAARSGIAAGRIQARYCVKRASCGVWSPALGSLCRAGTPCHGVVMDLFILTNVADVSPTARPGRATRFQFEPKPFAWPDTGVKHPRPPSGTARLSLPLRARAGGLPGAPWRVPTDRR
jgi:hypothetical protein